MKIKSVHILFMVVTFASYSCKKDNYKEPAAQLSGALQYKGENIGVERNQVPFQIYQYGFGKVGAINGTFEQDGTYGSLLFSGSYKFLIPSGQGPFIWKELAPGVPDSIAITMTGSQTLNIEVTPYYMIRNATISGGSGKVTAVFKAEKIITDANAKDIERVSLYINAGQFVGQDNIAVVNLAGADITDPNNISLQVAVPSITPAQSFVYARVGLKIANVEDMIFTPVQKVQY
ncbi:DUF3823 domain-containing protein [Flavitalea sp. BT771]|uniref:DUF3823 domain-containing protein n=1 Tax=Flavitalea sp. BT771 TaxID=3063329 RepID=UPI0026E22974|nr:DUF3823 domain-containing protein [Flavitalea sp. BT771]MDO6431926.1 DUF3823 domain-containing protein [Flavitalea sp. BT771]MDV6220835.1 DUF3823 domain-containing protein [Flavitalea sp. BT771]